MFIFLTLQGYRDSLGFLGVSIYPFQGLLNSRDERTVFTVIIFSFRDTGTVSKVYICVLQPIIVL